MAEFDEKLNSILSDPGAMAQIMQLAQSLSGPQQPFSPPPPSSQPAPPPPPQAVPFPGGMDAGLLMKLLPLVQELGGQNSNARTLLYALRPYLREDRQQKVERALQLARLFHIGKRFLTNWEG